MPLSTRYFYGRMFKPTCVLGVPLVEFMYLVFTSMPGGPSVGNSGLYCVLCQSVEPFVACELPCELPISYTVGL